MIKSEIAACFECDVKTIWDIVTDNKTYQWRSDLSRIEITGDDTFVEYGKNGFPTNFWITEKRPYRFYAFRLENKNLKGRWQGIFEERGGRTNVRFTEEIHVRNPLLRLFAKGYLRKQQKQYIEDLRNRLG